MKDSLPVIVLFGASILWGLSWLPLKQIHAMGIEGVRLIFGTYGILALVYLPLLVRFFQNKPSSLRDLLLIAILGGGANLCFTYALIHGNVVRVMVLFYLLPVWGVLGGYIFLDESIGIKRIVGAGCAIVGAFLILGGFDILHVKPSLMDGIALVAGMLFALNNILFRYLQAVSVNVKIGMMFVGCVILAGSLLLLGVDPASSIIGAKAYGALIAYALFWLLLANIGSQWGVTHMEAGRSSIIIIMELVTAVVSAAYLGEERLGLWEYIGGTLVVIAAFMEAMGMETNKEG